MLSGSTTLTLTTNPDQCKNYSEEKKYYQKTQETDKNGVKINTNIKKVEAVKIEGDSSDRCI